MSEKLKERLIGLFVLIGLVAIWLPFFIGEQDDSEKNNPSIKQSNSILAVVDSNPIPPKERTTHQQQKSISVTGDEIASLKSKIPVDTPSVTSLKRSDADHPEAMVLNADHKTPEHKTTPRVDSNRVGEDLLVQNQQLAMSDDLKAPASTFSPSKIEKSEENKVERLADEAPLGPLSQSLEEKPSAKNIKAPVKELGSPLPNTTPNPPKQENDGAFWRVQVTTLSQPSNVLLMMNKLKQRGFKPYQQKLQTAQGNSMTIIWVGQELKRNSADKLAARLKQTVGLDTKVLRTRINSTVQG